MTFAACRQAAVKDILGTEAARLLSGPNNNLGVEYLRALNALHSGIAPLAVLRRGAEHHGVGVEPGFAPAAQIRALIRAGDWGGAGALLPGGSGEALRGIELAELVRCERAVLARLRTMTPVDWAALPDGGAAEGLRSGSHAPPGRPGPWRNSIRWPRPSAIPTPGCADWPWGLSWG